MTETQWRRAAFVAGLFISAIVMIFCVPVIIGMLVAALTDSAGWGWVSVFLAIPLMWWLWFRVTDRA